METNKTLLNFSLFPLNGCRVKMVGPSTPVLAMLGVDVVLPCHLEPAADETKSTVEWSRSDLSPRFVHLRRDVVDLPKKQHLSYAGRTHLSSSRLKHGDLSLRLSNVKLSDEGKYSCIVPGKTSTEVHLLVGAAPPNVAVSAEADGSSGGVVLCCESAGWYPEPELLWLDSEGKLLSAGPPRTLRGPDGLYSVSSRVTVETRPSNTFSCRVQQSNISQSRTFFRDESSSAALTIVIVVLAVCFIISSSGLFAFWKLKLHKKSESLSV
uniref:Ig-like domain-containing protein n=1 Tax=Salarias fasciatus TaxID=181472 RepID=A0A672HJ57_SALFA